MDSRKNDLILARKKSLTVDSQEKTACIVHLLKQRKTVHPPKVPIESRRSGIKPAPLKSLFCTFDEQTLKEAFDSFKILYDKPDFSEFLSASEEIQATVNDDMFLFILYSSILHRNDTRDVTFPAVEEVAPHWFFAAETIHEAIQLSIHRPDEDHTIVNQRTAETSELESRLAYFREDVGMNIHHWAWHVVYPSVWDEKATGKMKDRKGEIFYYMHQQMIARYECERLSNGMNRVQSMRNFQEVLAGYSPHLTSQTTGVHFGNRPHGMTLRDLPNVSVQDLELWRTRILDAIDQGFVRDSSHESLSLDNDRGIDILGAIVEASSASVNRLFYGNFHNLGHDLIALIHDPDRRFREYVGAIGFSQTSARDPVFYQFHKYVDDIFQRHKATLRPYTREELSFEGIRITNAQVNAKQANVIETFMRQAKADLSNAPFLRTSRKIWVTYEHLDHEEFWYTIVILNETPAMKEGTVRVFLGPKYDETGSEFELRERKRLMIELDKFQIDLYAGENVVRRPSSQSNVTLRRRTNSFRSLQEGDFEPTVDFCSCGWPDHLLVPRGSHQGTDFVLFIMCTDYTQDRPDPDPKPFANTCSGAVSYCGSKDQKYPDRKPMGFPFDRPIDQEPSEFFTDNMITVDIKIHFMGPASE